MEIPVGYAVCPCCNGTGIGIALTDEEIKKYSHWASALCNDGKNWICQNCGGQTMSGIPLGWTKIDPATGLGCVHDYHEQTVGQCYHKHTCSKCQDYFHIDSGD